MQAFAKENREKGYIFADEFSTPVRRLLQRPPYLSPLWPAEPVGAETREPGERGMGRRAIDRRGGEEPGATAPARAARRRGQGMGPMGPTRWAAG